MDKELIKQAWATHYTRWYEIDYLIDQAESEETKEKLETIKKHKYHLEEGYE